MRLIKARVRGYRSVIDSGDFDIENLKTILVGPNEAGKTAILQALQKLNPPEGTIKYDALRDYPRSRYTNDIEKKGIDTSKFVFVEGVFELSDYEKSSLPEAYRNIKYKFGRTIDNHEISTIEGDYPVLRYSQIEKDLTRLINFFDESAEKKAGSANFVKPSSKLTLTINRADEVSVAQASEIEKFLKNNLNFINEESDEEKRYDKIIAALNIPIQKESAIKLCRSYLPSFVLFSNYFRIKPSINLQKLAERTEKKLLDDKEYDYGNNCLLKLLGFTARELSNLAIQNGKTEQDYKNQLDKRQYKLNSASIQLTNIIKEIWNPNVKKEEANKIRIIADGQYLKVVVEDDLGVEVELDQRSEGFQWMVSFFVVFFAEADEKHKNTILLLDEPGLSLHGLKQAEFRKTLDKLSESNQTIFTTHSPFLVGANELDKVRVVEMINRADGTKVHTTVTAGDKAALLPLQEALGYDLAQNLFINERNLVLEGLTDYWYLEGISSILISLGKKGLNDIISKVPADSASKVVYYATILHAQNLKVVALFDADNSGEQAAKQETLINVLGRKNILLTKEFYSGSVAHCEIEDLLRNSLVDVCKKYLGIEISQKANQQASRPIVDIIQEAIGTSFSKYKLARAFLKWASSDEIKNMPQNEIEQCEKLISKINALLS